jgi:hypothetical protein
MNKSTAIFAILSIFIAATNAQHLYVRNPQWLVNMQKGKSKYSTPKPMLIFKD